MQSNLKDQKTHKFLSFEFMIAIAILFLSVNNIYAKELNGKKMKNPNTLNENQTSYTQTTQNILFIGNSFTQRNNLTEAFKLLAEEGNPGIIFNVSMQTYGGRILKDHWRLRTQNFIKQKTLTIEEQQATIKYLEETIAKDPSDNYAVNALSRHKELLKLMGTSKLNDWDYVVLQSWRDDLSGPNSDYMIYAPMFAELIKAQGGKVLLYETTPTTHNAYPLTSPPTNQSFVLSKEKNISTLGRQIDALISPMAIVALKCQTIRPDMTLCYTDDNHPNQTMTYLTACTIYSSIFNRSAEGLSLDRISDDTRTPKLKAFSEKDRIDLQRIAWEGLTDFYTNLPTSSAKIICGNPIEVFPNPVSDKLTIRLNNNCAENNAIYLTIASLDGRIIYSKNRLNLGSEEFTINVSDLKSANYLIKIETSNETLFNKVITKIYSN